MKITEQHTGGRKKPKANGDSRHYIDRLRKRIFDLECSELGDRDLRIRVIEDVLIQLESGEIDDAQAKEQLSLASIGFDDSPKPTIAAELYEDKHGNMWEEPGALPGLPPVPEWTPDLAAEVLGPRLTDIADRIQCPADFAPVPTYVSLGALIGTKCAIRPGRKDDWEVVPNLWGMCIGRPAAMKTPPSAEVIKLMKRLDAMELKKHQEAAFDRVSADIQFKALKTAMENAAKASAKDPPSKRKAPDFQCYREDFDNFESEIEAAKSRKRHLLNDTTTEQLGQILARNPEGLMLYRDELKGWLRSLDKAGRESDRAFYLECWNGNGSFVYDRVERGEIPIQSACVSIFGNIQPGPLRSLLRSSTEGDSRDDGMIQRFQLMVYPDRLTEKWQNVDAFPDNDAKQAVWAVYQRLAQSTARDFRAEIPPPSDLATGIPYVRFDDEAQELWDAWRYEFENRLRSGEEHPAFEAHLTKYRSMVPSLALVNQLADVGHGPVCRDALWRAIAYAAYLEAHARRVYASVSMPDVDAAKALLAKLKAGRVSDDGPPLNPFQARHVYRKGWAGLTDGHSVHTAIDRLQDYGWVQRRIDDKTGGRDRADVYVHPDITKGWT